jgi:hypothetical protein
MITPRHLIRSNCSNSTYSFCTDHLQSNHMVFFCILHSIMSDLSVSSQDQRGRARIQANITDDTWVSDIGPHSREIIWVLPIVLDRPAHTGSMIFSGASLPKKSTHEERLVLLIFVQSVRIKIISKLFIFSRHFFFLNNVCEKP